MAETQTHPTPPSSRRSYGEQRSDVPYRWPRGPAARAPRQERMRKLTIGLTILICIAAAALLWMMIVYSDLG